MDTTKISFVRIAPFFNFKTSHPQDVLIPFGIGYAATLLKQRGYDIQIIDTWAEGLSLNEIITIILKNNTNVVIVESQTPTVNIAITLLSRIRVERKSTVTLMIGQHATALPQNFLSSNNIVDACVIGEPEETLLETMECLRNGKTIRQIKGIAYFDNENNKMIRNPDREPLGNLDTLPFIDYSLFRIGRYKKISSQVSIFGKRKWGFLFTSRGCPNRCVYCSPALRKSFGKSYRTMSPNRVVDEIEHLATYFGINAFSVEDDNFTLDRERVHAICSEITRRRLKIKWVAQAYIGDLDQALIKDMRDANCEGLCLGVESGNDRVLKLLKKGIKKTDIRMTIEYIKKAGIKLTLFFMIGNPTETYQEMEETLQFAKELKPLMIQVAYFTPYPGSLAFDWHSGDESRFENYSHYNRVACNLSNVDTEKLIQFQKIFYKEFYFSMPYILRYIKERGIYSLYRKDEIQLIQDALGFLRASGNGKK